jgi:hypothetical protein
MKPYQQMKLLSKSPLVPALALLTLSAVHSAPREISGVYPHLRTSNKEGECGTGAVVPWADRLWVITYGPHLPFGSSDKLYEITPDLKQIIRPESVGGTPANRMIHRESNQLLIGPYVIDANRNVRVIPPSKMFGRLTGTARHLSDPSKVYYATMEEGLYEVDPSSLSVRCLIRDGNLKESDRAKVEAHHFEGLNSQLPGYHGKGLYTAQGRVIYANNGDRDTRVVKDPTVPSGALGTWSGVGDWKPVRRNQFTEVTGPSGILGAAHPDSESVWSIGWDPKSLILMVLDEGTWHSFRLPKGSHSYDGAHGWNTEWPRIRDIGQSSLLMTMHGTFWSFPATFSAKKTDGIMPLSNYLRVIGDFAEWQGRIVMGCDDSAKNEFLNKRSFKNEHATPPQSNSNLWFVKPDALSSFGPAIGRGSVWLREPVPAGSPSDPFLTNGFDTATLHLAHDTDAPITFTVEADAAGNGEWKPLSAFTLEPHGSLSTALPGTKLPSWVRLHTNAAALNVVAQFHLARSDRRPSSNHADFAGIPPAQIGTVPEKRTVIRSLSPDQLGILSPTGAVYSLDTQLAFESKPDETIRASLKKAASFAPTSIREDSSSIILEEDEKRFRIPRGAAGFPAQSGGRVCREVATERDLLNVGGTFYELPARNAQGIAKMRPIATHLLEIDDFASQFGLTFIASASPSSSDLRTPLTNGRLFVLPDHSATLWAGVIDDLWKLGKPRGVGGPWQETATRAGVPSDPYLMTGYDRKTLTLVHSGNGEATITVEVDVDGTGVWIPYRKFTVTSTPLRHAFPEGFNAYWVRFTSDTSVNATAQMLYE